MLFNDLLFEVQYGNLQQIDEIKVYVDNIFDSINSINFYCFNDRLDYCPIVSFTNEENLLVVYLKGDSYYV